MFPKHFNLEKYTAQVEYVYFVQLQLCRNYYYYYEYFMFLIFVFRQDNQPCDTMEQTDTISCVSGNMWEYISFCGAFLN